MRSAESTEMTEGNTHTHPALVSRPGYVAGKVGVDQKV